MNQLHFLPKMKSGIKTEEEMRMQTVFEKMGVTYRQEGGYLLPNIEAPESPQIGFWGQQRLQYIRAHKNVLYMTMLMSGKLKDHLEEVDHTAEEMFDILAKRMATLEGVTEALKASDQMAWVTRMNEIRKRAAEIVYQELIYE